MSHLQSTSDQFSDIVQRLVRIETTVMDQKHRLFGNGQPGELTLLQEEIEHVRASTGVKIAALEKKWTVAIGWLAGAGFVVNFFTGGGFVSLKGLLGILK